MNFFKKMIYGKRNRIFLLFALCLSVSCKKLVEVSAPITTVNSGNVFADNTTAISAVTAMYSQLINTNFTGNLPLPATSVSLGLSADELTLYNTGFNPTLTAIYRNALTNQIPGPNYFWNQTYKIIYQANASIEGLNSSISLTPAVKQDLLGEAYFSRAFGYFYLVNLFGDIPMPLTTDQTKTALLSRTPAPAVYAQIVSDLVQAQKLLPKTYVDASVLNSTNERTRPNYWTATALLARAYLYTADYKNAAAQAGMLISNTSMFQLSPLNSVFLRASSGNKEAIWQLQSIGAGNAYNSPDGVFFIIPPTGLSSAHYTYLSPSLLSSFEPGDQRRVNWVNSVTVSGKTYYYPYKYKVNTTGITNATEYEVVFRLAEQYLIRAEAEANLGDMTSAANDLNTVRGRAGLPPSTVLTSTATLAQAQTAILHERQVELFTEYGHRWFDLKRTNTINAVMGAPGNACAAKGGTWNSNAALFPIPLSEIQADPNLSQNPGY